MALNLTNTPNLTMTSGLVMLHTTWETRPGQGRLQVMVVSASVLRTSPVKSTICFWSQTRCLCYGTYFVWLLYWWSQHHHGLRTISQMPSCEMKVPGSQILIYLRLQFKTSTDSHQSQGNVVLSKYLVRHHVSKAFGNCVMFEFWSRILQVTMALWF